MKRISLFALALVTACSFQLAAAESEAGFVSLFDGKTFNGWKKAVEHPDTWKIEDGALVAHGDRNHLFYVGDLAPFKNFELRVEVMTKPGSNGGIYFHTKYQPDGWPKYGFETQVNNTHGDWKKTGSIYDVVNVRESAAKDNQWWTQDIIVNGNRVHREDRRQDGCGLHRATGNQAGQRFYPQIGRRHFRSAGPRSEQHNLLQKHSGEAAAVVQSPDWIFLFERSPLASQQAVFLCPIAGPRDIPLFLFQE